MNDQTKENLHFNTTSIVDDLASFVTAMYKGFTDEAEAYLDNVQASVEALYDILNKEANK